jgi:hypothetical protein
MAVILARESGQRAAFRPVAAKRRSRPGGEEREDEERHVLVRLLERPVVAGGVDEGEEQLLDDPDDRGAGQAEDEQRPDTQARARG